MIFAIKAHVSKPRATTFVFDAQKTMYGGKHIGKGDTIFVFASENEGGRGLIASGLVASAMAIPKKPAIARQTPRVSITVKRMASAKRHLGRSELKGFSDWNDGRPETELNFKFYRQATNKIVGISDEAAAFLRGFFLTKSNQLMRTRTFAALILALACQRTSATSQVDKTFLLGFLAGEYRLVGQAPDSGAPYVGQVTLREHKGSLEIVRTVAGVSTRGSGTVEAAGEGGTLVLKARFSVSGVAYEATYLWKSDLDNYPRLTGYTYRAAGETKSPGLEALFHIPPTPKK